MLDYFVMFLFTYGSIAVLFASMAFFEIIAEPKYEEDNVFRILVLAIMAGTLWPATLWFMFRE